MITLRAEGRTLKVLTPALLTSGSVGIAVTFAFDGAWNELARTAVFAGSGRQVDVLLDESNTCLVPPEVLARPGNRLRIGVYGTDDQETAVIPTVWADLGRIERGAVPSGIDPAELTPSLAAQVLAAASQALQTAQAVMAAAAAGQFDGETGPQGPQGERGHTGLPGVLWYTTSAPVNARISIANLWGPYTAVPAINQQVISANAGEMYLYLITAIETENVVLDVANRKSIKGDKGDPGDDGELVPWQEAQLKSIELDTFVDSPEQQYGAVDISTEDTGYGSNPTLVLAPKQANQTAVKVKNIAYPDNDGEAANKQYVDDRMAAVRFDVTLTGLTYNTSGIITGGTLDKTFQQIVAAEQAGKIVRLKILFGSAYTIIPLWAVSSTGCTFAATFISDPGDVMGSSVESARVIINNQNAISGEYHEY